MNKPKRFPFSALLMLLATCIALVGIHKYRESLFTYVGPVRYEKPVTSLDMSNAPLRYVDDIIAQPGLQELDVRGTGITISQYRALQARLPGCTIYWDVPFQGNYYSPDCESLTITQLRNEDIAVLDYFPNLKYIDATGCTDYFQLEALALHRPDCQVDYAVVIEDRTFPMDTTEAAFPGVASEMLMEYLVHLPNLKSIEITEPLGDSESLLALEAAFPQIKFHWSVNFLDMVLDKDTTTTLDLANIPLTPGQIDAIIPYLPNLTFIDMSYCGISNEEMDALNRRHENVKIVWTVQLGRYFTKRTDATYFMPGKYANKWVSTQDCYNLRYCTDMICVDLGHMKVENCEWAAYMPKLKYLLLADTLVSDISPGCNRLFSPAGVSRAGGYQHALHLRRSRDHQAADLGEQYLVAQCPHQRGAASGAAGGPAQYPF